MFVKNMHIVFGVFFLWREKPTQAFWLVWREFFYEYHALEIEYHALEIEYHALPLNKKW